MKIIKTIFKKYEKFLNWTLGTLNAAAFTLIIFFKDDGTGCCFVSFGVFGIAICLVLVAVVLIYRFNMKRAEKFINRIKDSDNK